MKTRLVTEFSVASGAHLSYPEAEDSSIGRIYGLSWWNHFFVQSRVHGETGESSEKPAVAWKKHAKGGKKNTHWKKNWLSWQWQRIIISLQNTYNYKIWITEFLMGAHWHQPNPPQHTSNTLTFLRNSKQLFICLEGYGDGQQFNWTIPHFLQIQQPVHPPI